MSNFIHPNLSVEMLTEVVGIKIAQVGQTSDYKITVVIIYYNIFLPLLLTLLSDNLVLLSPFPPPPLVTNCLPYRIDYRLSNGCNVAHTHAQYISCVHF